MRVCTCVSVRAFACYDPKTFLKRLALLYLYQCLCVLILFYRDVTHYGSHVPYCSPARMQEVVIPKGSEITPIHCTVLCISCCIVK